MLQFREDKILNSHKKLILPTMSYVVSFENVFWSCYLLMYGWISRGWLLLRLQMLVQKWTLPLLFQYILATCPYSCSKNLKKTCNSKSTPSSIILWQHNNSKTKTLASRWSAMIQRRFWLLSLVASCHLIWSVQ